MKQIGDKNKTAGRKFRAVTFGTAALNIYESSVCGLLHDTILASGI
jgi:hypothetical protein